MEDKDHIKELFKDQLDGFEANVRPDLWNAISSQLPVSVQVPPTGLSGLTKTLLIAASAAVVGVIVYIVSINESSQQQTKIETILKSEQAEGVESTNQIDSSTKLENTLPVVDDKEKVNNETIVQLGSADHFNIPVVEQLNVFFANTSASELFSEKTENNAMAIEEITSVKPQEKIQSNLQTTVEELVIEEQSEQLYSLVDPVNVFTPNGDGVNDIFELPSEGLEEFSIVVLDGRNKTVFSSVDPQFKWDGTFSGEPLPSGNFIYYLTARDKKGNLVTQSSYLRIVR